MSKNEKYVDLYVIRTILNKVKYESTVKMISAKETDKSYIIKRKEFSDRHIRKSQIGEINSVFESGADLIGFQTLCFKDEIETSKYRIRKLIEKHFNYRYDIIIEMKKLVDKYKDIDIPIKQESNDD